MIKVTFISAEGDMQIVEAEEGEGLLELAQAAGQPLEGTCEGQMACSTCHVIIDKDWFEKLPRAVEDEEDMLDLASGARRTSRLSCQIVMDDGIRLWVDKDGRVIRIKALGNISNLAAIEQVLVGLQTSQAPPAGMPPYIDFKIKARKPGI